RARAASREGPHRPHPGRARRLADRPPWLAPPLLRAGPPLAPGALAQLRGRQPHADRHLGAGGLRSALARLGPALVGAGDRAARPPQPAPLAARAALGGAQLMSRFRSAYATAAVRSLTPSFSYMFAKWVLTVPGLMNSRWAMSGPLWPAAASLR